MTQEQVKALNDMTKGGGTYAIQVPDGLITLARNNGQWNLHYPNESITIHYGQEISDTNKFYLRMMYREWLQSKELNFMSLFL
jgi:hypothetical protein